MYSLSFTKALFLAVSWCLLSVEVVGQVKLQKISPDKEKMANNWESYFDSVPVSGDLKVGFISPGNDESLIPRSFFIKLPKHNKSVLCVEISSRDGRYEANLVFGVKQNHLGTYELLLPTKYLKELRNYKIQDMSILAKLGDECNSEDYVYIPSSWNRPSFNSSLGLIYLNTQQPTYIEATNIKSNRSDRYRCRPITRVASIAFNCQCEIPLLGNSSNYTFRVVQKIPKPAGNGFQFTYSNFPISF